MSTETKSLAVLPKETDKMAILADHVAFLLDREMRMATLQGRASRAKACKDRIHSLGLKTVAEQEEEAETLRIEKLAAASAAQPDE